ncbi:MAG: plasmid pRiA4b ORF-3 family protein [Bacteroidales bacterium]|nr:plasmid pRiA4b ORF-3 family protein [Bacteroidales bacterium]
MIIKFRIISPENEDFVRDIEIFDDSSFLELHEAIQAACDYDSSIMSAFYTSNQDWEREQEIVLQIIDEDEQQDSLLMDETLVNEFFNKKGQRLIYIYDFFSIRLFLIEVVNIRKAEKEDADLDFPICTLYKSHPPQQIKLDDISPEAFSDNFDDEFGNDFDEYGLDDDDFYGFENIDDYDF